MKQRYLSKIILRYVEQYPILAIVGPRQSGKTTLAKALFENYDYVSLESLDNRTRAEQDPRAFIDDHGVSVIIDEIQRVPSLFSYLQEAVDSDPSPGRFILTGSHQFSFQAGVSQSLAGRIATFSLFPFCFSELLEEETPSLPPGVKALKSQPPPFWEIAFTGLYPRIHDRALDPVKWLDEYLHTFVERDVRQLSQVGDLTAFVTFLKLTAARSGQILNYASLSNDAGVSQPTVKRWISLLETSGILFLLPPYFRNIGKRLVKAPKLYFTDTGLLCRLLSIRDTDQLKSHPLYGSIFETFVVAELYKLYRHMGETPPLYYFRDKTGNEVDVLIEDGQTLIPIEIKSSMTFDSSFKDGILKLLRLLKNSSAKRGFVVYNGREVIGKNADITATPWYMFV